MFQSLNLPLELTQEITRRKRLKPYQVFLALKFAYSGQVRKDDIDYQLIGDIAGFKDRRTVQAHLDTAIRLNWIGSDNQWLFIRSFDRLRKDHKTHGKSAIEISIKDVSNILELTLSAKIEHRARSIRHARKKSGAEPRPIEPHSDFKHDGTDFGMYKVSCSLIGDWFNFSPSTATRIKQRARQIGYIDYLHHYTNTGLYKSNLPDLSDHIDPTRLFVKNGKVCIRLTDEFIISGKNHIYKFRSRKSIGLQNVQ